MLRYPALSCKWYTLKRRALSMKNENQNVVSLSQTPTMLTSSESEYFQRETINLMQELSH